MESEAVDGGTHDSLSPHPDLRHDHLPGTVATALSHLAHILDEQVAVRGSGIGVRDFAARFFGLPRTQLVVTEASFSVLDFQLVSLALADDLREHTPAGLIGEDEETPPRWDRLELGDEHVRVPAELAVAFARGTVALRPLVIEVGIDWPGPRRFLRAYSLATDTDAAETYLDGLQRRARERTNPFRGRCIETIPTASGLLFRVAPTPETARADVVLPEPVWQQIEQNVHGLFRAAAVLDAAGLATSRGVLLTGPPGTGKTAVCRALARELVGPITVVFCDAPTVEQYVGELYDHLVVLAPALVVMEDLDLIIGHRNERAGRPLLEFLVALDGATSSHRNVVTIATTNDPEAIDPAARRAARFDAIIEVPTPDASGRAAIVSRYLEGVHSEVDVQVVAGVTSGMTGAELREMVSRAVILATTDSTSVDTALLCRLARARPSRESPGQYL